MDKKALHSENPSEKMGLENPGLIMGSTVTIPPPPYSEKEETQRSKKEALNSVYVVPRFEKPLKDSYNPYEHRQVKHPTTFYETLFHLLKASLGTGILAMPNAFHNAGYLVGLVGTLIIGFLCTYSVQILISAEYELCRRRKKPSMTYPETLEAALLEGPPIFRGLAPYADFVVNLFLICYQLGTCCIYHVFVAHNIKVVADEYTTHWDVRIYMVILLVPLLLINSVRNLKFLAPFSTLANSITLLSFVIIGYYLFTDIPSIEDRSPVANFRGMPLFFGTVLFAMESIGVMMPLENEMADPKRFGSLFGVLNCAMLPITVLYTFVGFFGYLKYGMDTQGSITLNLPNDHLMVKASRLMLAFSICVTHSLAGYVAYDIIWNQKLKKVVTKNSTFWAYFVKLSIVFFTCVFAVAIPNLELFISLIGAFCLSTIGLAFPAFIQMLTFWDFYSGFGKVLFFLKNLIVVLFAVLGFSIGVSTSLHEIYIKFFM